MLSKCCLGILIYTTHELSWPTPGFRQPLLKTRGLDRISNTKLWRLTGHRSTSQKIDLIGHTFRSSANNIAYRAFCGNRRAIEMVADKRRRVRKRLRPEAKVQGKCWSEELYCVLATKQQLLMLMAARCRTPLFCFTYKYNLSQRALTGITTKKNTHKNNI